MQFPARKCLIDVVVGGAFKVFEMIVQVLYQRLRLIPVARLLKVDKPLDHGSDRCDTKRGQRVFLCQLSLLDACCISCFPKIFLCTGPPQDPFVPVLDVNHV